MRNSPRPIEDQALKTGETVRLRARDATDQSLARRVLPGKFHVSLYDIYIYTYTHIYIFVYIYIYMYIRNMYIIHAIWRFPKSWGTPKSSTSWMSILDHGDLGTPQLQEPSIFCG